MQLTPQVKSALLTAVFTTVMIFLVNLVYTHFYPSIDTSKQTPFTVNGTGTATAKPDQAQISFSVTKTATTLQDTQNQANSSTNTIVSDLQKLGIAKSDIQTNNYNSNPNYATTDTDGTNEPAILYRPVQPNQTILSYTVSEDVNVDVKDQTKVNTVIDTITKDNAENIAGPNYTFSDAKEQSLENQARTQAIANAKQKAQSIAEASGIHLGRILNVQEDDTGGFPQPILMNSKIAVPQASGAVPTQINPGENTVTENVTLSYETY